MPETDETEGVNGTCQPSRQPVVYIDGDSAVDRAVIQKMLDNGVEYVILDQLGYSSTPRYLYPAIQKNDDLFFVASHVPNPDTYLLKFDREAAKKKLSQSQRQDGKNTLP